MRAYLHVVRDLAEVVNTHILLQNGIAHCTPVNTGVGAYFTIITNDDGTQLWHFFPVVICECNAETIRTDNNPRVDDDSLAKLNAVAN